MHTILSGKGVVATRALFVILHLGIILSWAVQLAERDEERVREEIINEILWWDDEIHKLEMMLWEFEVSYFESILLCLRSMAYLYGLAGCVADTPLTEVLD